MSFEECMKDGECDVGAFGDCQKCVDDLIAGRQFSIEWEVFERSCKWHPKNIFNGAIMVDKCGYKNKIFIDPNKHNKCTQELCPAVKGKLEGE